MSILPNEEREFRRERLSASMRMKSQPKTYKKKIKPGQPDFDKLRLADQYQMVWELILLQRKRIDTAQTRIEILEKEKGKIARTAKKMGVRFTHAHDGKKVVVMQHEIDKDFE